MVARIDRVPVLVVLANGSVGLRMGEATTTPGLIVVADCPACAEPAARARHLHGRWRVQTIFGYLVGDQCLTSRRDAHAAAAALGALSLDWSDARLAIDDDAVRPAVGQVLARWGLTRAVA